MQPNTERSESLRYSVAELAAKLGLSDESVYRGIRSGQIPAIRVGRRLIIPKLAIEKWLRSADGTGVDSRPTGGAK